MKIKIPEKPPSREALGKLPLKQQQELFKLLSPKDPNRSIIQKANKKYLYWDKFKQVFPKEKGDPKLGWLVLKIFRRAQAKNIPILDVNAQNFNYWIPDEIVKNLQMIDSSASGQIFIEEPIINKQAQEKYLINSLMEEAISSSILEGAATTREKAKETLLSGKKPSSHPDKMVFNNYLTIKKIGKFKNEPLSKGLLEEIHNTITKGTLENPDACGRFRNDQDEAIAVKDHYGTQLFIPPPVNEINERIEALIWFTNEEDKGEYVHPVIKAMMIHFILAYIHPFVDGNGRTARALFYWYMLKRGYWLIEYVSISKYFLESPTQYAKAYLYTEQDEGDLTYFLFYHLKILCRAFEDLKQYIGDRQKKIQQFSNAVKNYPQLNLRQTILLQHALRHPNFHYTIQKHKNYHNIAYQTARSDMLDLEEKGFFEKLDKGKEFYFLLKDGFQKELEGE